VDACHIAMGLRQGSSVSDRTFDALLSSSARLASRRFWTPVDVVQRAAGWLEDAGAERLLDVGSGVGKFCIVGALSTGLDFVGVEKRALLVAEAESLAARLEVKHRARFVNASFTPSLVDGYDSIYAFNPFAENLYDPSETYDRDPSLRVDNYARELGVFEALMARAPVGCRIVTYHGCGARIPDSYELSRSEHVGTNVLRLWTKARSDPRNCFWRERFATTELCSPGGRALLSVPAMSGNMEGAVARSDGTSGPPRRG
jgi:hypothetical protein